MTVTVGELMSALHAAGITVVADDAPDPVPVVDIDDLDLEVDQQAIADATGGMVGGTINGFVLQVDTQLDADAYLLAPEDDLPVAVDPGG